MKNAVVLNVSPEGGNPTLSMYSRVFFICGTPAVLTKPGLYCYDRHTGTIYYTPDKRSGDTEFAIGIADGLLPFASFASLSLHGLTFTGIEDAVVREVGYYAPGQAAWHILCEDNYIACAKDFGEVYRSQRVDPVYASDMLDVTRDLCEKGTVLFATEDALRADPDAAAVIAGAGAFV